jgi:outer membrane receptor protein involved in Fe transport
MKYFFVLFFSVISFFSLAQPRGGGMPQTGRVYGKVVDSKTKENIEYAVIQVFQSIAGDTLPKLINGGLSESNGDFSVDKIPLNIPLSLRVIIIGFDPIEKTFTLSSSEKDLGNIAIVSGATTGEVVIDGSDPAFRIEFDKRVFDAEKNPIAAGGTAEDLLRNVPSLQVDMDGNVSMRNTAPQIFVDGRPTTLTIDQIPADAIKSVEVITNPGAKYDASGGGGGIVNIVMKHNRGMGYNGSLRVGVDSRPRFNTGLDLNLREGKWNFFTNGNFNQRKSISQGYTRRTDLTGSPSTYLDQNQTSTNLGFFGNGKIGADWVYDNRNTFTLSQSFTRGSFNPHDDINAQTDTLLNIDQPNPFSTYVRTTDTHRDFQNMGSSFLYKHLFAKEGTELTADVNYNAIKSEFVGDYMSRYDDTNEVKQRQEGSGAQQLYTGQADFTTKPNDKVKIDAGVRGSYRHYESKYDNSIFNGEEYVPIPSLMVNYEYDDQVYAAYTSYSRNAEHWKYQVGLRLESSDYKGRLRDTTLTFQNSYPLSVFPSVFLTRIINDKQDLQLAVSRKINRPGFMQMIPFMDYTDSLNVSRGNPSLKPEFTNLIELSYQYNINKQNTFLASAYARYTTDLTVRNQVVEYSDVLQRDVVVNTYDNANSSTAFGLELVSKNTLAKWFDLTANFNLYQSSIDGTNISSDLRNSRASFWFKTNAIIKLPGNATFQALFDYSSKRSLEVGSSERGGGGGGGMGGGGFGGTNNTVQGYVRPTYSLDLSVKKEFLKNRNLSLTLSMQDVLKTRISYTHSETSLFVQDTYRRRDWQVVRLQLNWKFGKVDSSLFKRKNNRQSEGGMEG